MVYYVKLEDRVLESIVNSKIKFKKSYNNLVNIGLLKKACNINLRDKFCNVNLQYLWFCLNGKYVYRNFVTGWKTFKVSFSDTYADNSEKNKRIILNAYDSCPKPKSKIFSNITGKHYVSIREYISGKGKIPISLFLKSCQLLNKNPWVELENCKIYSGSSSRDKYIILKNEISAKLYILLNWIKLEGNLSLINPRLTISQNNDEILCFEKLVNYFQEVFNLSKESIRIYNSLSRPKISILSIASAPLRQILNLKYQIPLGYKSRDIKPNDYFKFRKEDELNILASELETEGSFARHKKFNITHCDVSFSTYSRDYSKSVFNKLKNFGYPVSLTVSKRNRNNFNEKEYKVVFWGSLELQKLAFEIMPYFYHLGKIRNLVEVIKQRNYLKITRIDFNDDIKKLIYQAKETCGNFKSLTYQLNKEGLESSKDAIESWIYQKHGVPVYALIKMCYIIGEKNYFRFIPKELALSLWLHGFIDRKEAENVRGIKNAYKHIEN